MTPWVTRLLVANVVMFFLAYPGSVAFRLLWLVPVALPTQPWTALTYMFLHGSTGHLFFNMLALFFFGPRVEAKLGGKIFLRLYLLSGFGAALFSLIFAPFSPVVGASGAVYGVLLAFAMNWPREPIYIWMILPIEARWLIAAMTALSLYSGFTGAQDGVAHFAHLGGFAGGFVYLKLHERKRKRARKGGAGGSILSVPGVKLHDMHHRWRAIRLDELHELNRGEVEELLRKAQREGVTSLTPEEREFLERMANAQGLV